MIESHTTLRGALAHLCGGLKIQSGEHIKPLHQYCSARLVLEGGFPPEWLNPTAPLASKGMTNHVHKLVAEASPRRKEETRVLGGIKYKDVDVTVVVPNIGPALAISAKNTGNAFRNLTNRMEEALGECTNVHMMYPGFVFGFLHLIKFAKEPDVARADASFDKNGDPLPSIKRYHEVLASLSGRSALTDAGMKYEAVGLLVYRCENGVAEICSHYPAPESAVHFSKFFQRLYDLCDLRFGYPDPDGPNVRKSWSLEESKLGTVHDKDVGFPWEVRLPE